MYLEGSPHPDILEILSPYLSEQEYGAPIGTLWSLPRSHRYSVRTAPELFVRLSTAAAHRAEPEICDHLHFYRGDEPLANWFDAFHDPFLLTTAIPRDRVERFCDALRVPFPHAAA